MLPNQKPADSVKVCFAWSTLLEMANWANSSPRTHSLLNLHQLRARRGGDVTFTGCNPRGTSEVASVGTNYQQMHLKFKVVREENSEWLLPAWTQPSNATSSGLNPCLNAADEQRGPFSLFCPVTIAGKQVKPPLSGHSCSAGSKNYPMPAVLMGWEQAVRAGSHPSTKAMDQQAAPTGEKGEIPHHFLSRFPRASEKCY